MSEKRKAAPGVGAPEAAEEKATGKTAYPCEHFIMTGGNRQDPLLSLLQVGRDGALTAGELASMLDVPPRVVTRRIERLKQAGYPICAACSEPFGYYLAGSSTELSAYRRSLNRRLRSIQKSAAGLELAQALLFGQTSMWEAER